MNNCYNCADCQDFDESGTTEYYCKKHDMIVDPLEPVCKDESKRNIVLTAVPCDFNEDMPMFEPDTVRLAIIDPGSKSLYVEDVIEDEIMKYPSIKDYVEDNYMLSEGYAFSVIKHAEYLPFDDKDPIEINFDEL